MGYSFAVLQGETCSCAPTYLYKLRIIYYNKYMYELILIRYGAPGLTPTYENGEGVFSCTGSNAFSVPSGNI